MKVEPGESGGGWLGDWMILIEPAVVLAASTFRIAVTLGATYAAYHFIVKFW